jgi:hypothetical protein
MEKKWTKEKDLINKVKKTKEKLEKAKFELDKAYNASDYKKASEIK